MQKEQKTVTVIGLGYVGLPLALLVDRKGYRVIGIDTNEQKIKLLREKIVPFKDITLEKDLKKSNLEATTDFAGVKEADIIVICVPTPVYENKMPNLEPIESACRAIAPHLQHGALVVLESTVNPGVCDTIVIPLLERGSSLKAGKDFFVAHCPERVNPGDIKWHVGNIPRVVGSLEAIGLEKALAFYQSIIDAEIKPMGSLMEAEAVKIVENSFRDVNIAFVNELAMSFSTLGIDTVRVIQGAATKPFAFMAHYPGCGVGGHCIPVDPYYLIEYARENGFHHEFLSLARQINARMPEYTVEQVILALKKKEIAISRAKITVLGLAYKADIDDRRESPSFEIIACLKKAGTKVVTYDPFVPDMSDAATLDEALAGADAVVVATNHSVFVDTLTPEYLGAHGIKMVIDGRNCLDKGKIMSAGIDYIGIGR